MSHGKAGDENTNNDLAAYRRGGWTLLAPIHHARTLHSTSAVDDHRIVVTGGIGGCGGFTSVELLDIKKNCWYDLPDLFGPSGKASIALKGYLYFMGGCGSDTVQRVAIDRIGSLVVEDAANMKADRGGFAAVTDEKFIYVLGGYTNYESISSVELYDPTANTWIDLPEMEYPRHHHAAVRVQGQIYVLGGYDSATLSVLSSVEVYDINTGSWQEASENNACCLPEPLVHLSAASIDDRWIVVTGGARVFGGGLIEDVSDLSYIYDTESKSWSKGSFRLSRPREKHGVAVLGSSRLVVVGGGQGRLSNLDLLDNLLDSVESIDFKDLFASWDHVGHFILLRKLCEEDRAAATNDTEMLVEKLVTVFDGGIFRKVLSFLLYHPVGDQPPASSLNTVGARAVDCMDSKRQRLS
jgi:N-acetylneuraminic acid mutarotase